MESQDEVKRMLPQLADGKKTTRKFVESATFKTMLKDANTIRFTVPCAAMGSPRMTQSDKWNKRPVVIRYRNVKDAIREHAPALPPIEQIESLSWTAYFCPPKSWSVKKRAAAIGMLHRSKPDRDNIDKTIMDALFEQDQGIAHGTICKRWDHQARIEIEIVLTKETI